MPRTVAQIEAELTLVGGAISKALERMGEDAIIAYQTDGRGASILRGTDLQVLFDRQDALYAEKDRASTQGSRRGMRTFSVVPRA